MAKNSHTQKLSSKNKIYNILIRDVIIQVIVINKGLTGDFKQYSNVKGSSQSVISLKPIGEVMQRHERGKLETVAASEKTLFVKL